jgi:murein DD-endopeptidase MepM/ murein hydrolase activator NlpD
MKIKINPGLDHITNRADLLHDFVVFVCKDLECMPCDIDIVNGRDGSKLKTTAQYNPNSHHVMVNAKNRHFGDVLRSIAHELVHHKQNVKGELNGPVQDVGGDIEDEANSRAGALLKSFAYREGPERIYEQVSEETKKARQSLATQLRTFLGKVPAVGGRDDDATPDEQGGTGVEPFPKSKASSKQMKDLLQGNPVPEYETGALPPVAGMGAPSLSDKTTKRYAYKGKGVPVQSILTGVVKEIGSNQERGNFVQVFHRINRDDGSFDIYRVTYEHLAELNSDIAIGKSIGQGIVLGFVGTSAEKGNEENDVLDDDLFEIEIVHTANVPADAKPRGATLPNAAVDVTTFKTKNEAVNAKVDRVIFEQKDELLALKQQFLSRFAVRQPLDNIDNVSSPYGPRGGHTHKGVDYRSTPPSKSNVNPVYSAMGGKVTNRRDGAPDRIYSSMKELKANCPGKSGGNRVWVEAPFRLPGGRKLVLAYGHLYKGSVTVKVGDIVKPGQKIGMLGASGCTTGPHLHFQMNLYDSRDYIKSYKELQDEIGKLKAEFRNVMSDDVKFLSLFEKTVPESYRKPKTSNESTEGQAVIKNYINEIVSAYGTGRLDPMGGGLGSMFKLGVDYKNASTNVPRAGTGYVDRTHAVPYEIVIKTNSDPRELYKTMFKNDFESEQVTIVPDQVHYGRDGLKIQSHVSTSRNKADSSDAKLVQDALYSSILGLPGTPKNAQFVIDVKPVASKIKHFD